MCKSVLVIIIIYSNLQITGAVYTTEALTAGCGHGGCWVQPTVTLPIGIGDHVNGLHDYKKTGPSKILKLLSCRCHHLIDMLVEFCQNHIFLTLKTAELAISVNIYYQFLHKLLRTRALWRKNRQKSFRLFNSCKHPRLHC